MSENKTTATSKDKEDGKTDERTTLALPDNANLPSPAAATTTTTATTSPYESLIRRSTTDMESVSLLTGLYGSRGERIRHVAHKGALQLPEYVLPLVTPPQASQQRAAANRLPGLDAVQRPSSGISVDTTSTTTSQRPTNFTVTKVYMETVPTMDPVTNEQTFVTRTVANNIILPSPGREDAPERIRGGAGDDEISSLQGGETPSSSSYMPTTNPGASAPPHGQVGAAAAAGPTPTHAPAASQVEDTATYDPTSTPAPVASQVTSAAAAPTPTPALVANQVGAVAALPPGLAPPPTRVMPPSAAPPTTPATETTTTTTTPMQTLPTKEPNPLADSNGGVTTTKTTSAFSAPNPLASSSYTTTAAATAPSTEASKAETVATTTAATVSTATPSEPPVPASPVSATAASQPTAPTSAPSSVVATTVPTTTAPKTEPPIEKNIPPPLPEPVIIKALDTTPTAQWEQHKPGPSDEMTVDPATKTPKPDWFLEKEVSHLERTCLPEWFDGSARHRTTESYLRARNQIIQMGQELGTKYVTATLVRRSIPGDAGSLLRLHDFLSTHALINEDATNDSAPTSQTLLGAPANVLYWNERKDERLMESVVEQARHKKPRLDDDLGETAVPSVDWDAVAEKVGMTAAQCEERFLVMPMTAPAGSVTPDVSEKADETIAAIDEAEQKKPSVTEMVHDLVSRTDPAVIHSVLEAAKNQTVRLGEAQNAALVGLALQDAAQEARSAQDALAQIATHVVELRMQKLEHRMAFLDDVEGLLEAERVALELERRDLYTARCRHWFGGA